jgi:hypothetical protein
MNAKSLIILMLCINSALEAEIIADFGSECLIHNFEYRFEYLHSSLSKNEAIKPVHLIPLRKVNDFSNMRWSLIETNNQSEIFYLKSSFYGDFLCASSSFVDLFQSRREVFRLEINENLYQTKFNNCKWSIKRVNSNKMKIKTYSIINVLYEEPLYASSYFFQKKFDNREIYLWNGEKDLLE